MLSTTPHHLRPRTVSRAFAASLVAAAASLTLSGPSAFAATVTSPPATPASGSPISGSATPTVSHTPKPIVSPFAGPLTLPCDPAAGTHPSPLITDPPSSLPSTEPAGPIGGPRMADTGVVVGAGAPSAPNISAASWVVADADTGEILGAKNPHGHYLPASVLKTLTAVTLIPRLDPCMIYTATKVDLHAECTCVGVADGTAYRIKMLFTGMLIYSGNDAANTLAGAYGGVDKTIAAMNAEAHYLKAYDTVAGTPSGLDTPGEHSSAYDMALIARAGLAMPDFRSYVSTRHVLFPVGKGKTETKFTHVKLLPNYDGAIGIKNGFTVAAQATYVGAATRGGHTIIATLMHSTVGLQVWHEDAALLDWGFAALGRTVPVGRLVDPDLPPAPSASTSATRTATSAGAAGTTRSGSANATSVVKGLVTASANKHSGASGASIAIPLSLAGVLVIGSAVVLTTLQRRRRGRDRAGERALRF